MHTLIEHPNYEAALSLLGHAETTDPLLERIHTRISENPGGFPMVSPDGLRVASVRILIRGMSGVLSIFFSQSSLGIELLWAYLRCDRIPAAA
jgi:hypothetical protein